MDMHGNADRSPKESGGSNDILGKNKLFSGDGGDTPESSSKKPKLTNDSREEERPSIPPFSEMEQPTRVYTFAELMGSSHPSRDVSNQVSRQVFGDSSRVGISQGQGSGVTRDPQNVGQRDIQPSDGPPERKDKKGVNLVRINGWRPMTATEFAPLLLMHVSNNQRQSQLLKTRNEQAFLTELGAGGFSFEEVACYHQSRPESFLSCDFSTDGKYLACAGLGRKVTIWNKEYSNFSTTQDQHISYITEVRFRPGSTIFATSSFDQTVKLWDAYNPAIAFCVLRRDNVHIASLDFHPRDPDILCWCDMNGLIQLWRICNQGIFLKSFKGGTRKVRFQPRLGKFLAATTPKVINIFETNNYRIFTKLEGFSKEVISVCWDQTGSYIASLSEDEARVWSVASGRFCLLRVLRCEQGKFRSCIFHPRYPNLLVICGRKYLQFWIPRTGRTLTINHDDGKMRALATSPQNEFIASVSGDFVKLWKCN